MKRVLVALVVALLAAPVVVRAQEAFKFAVIDVDRIRDESTMGKEIKGRLMKLQEEKIAQGKRLADELEAIRKQVATQAATLSDAKLKELQKRGEDKQVEIDRFQEDARQQLMEAQRKEFADLEKQVMPLINELCREMKYLMVFNKYQSGLIYADEAVDVTDKVLVRFNSKVTK
ncbi:MAG: OmpH family outer membrane protein [Acidobacteria bacterium]|nr:OmpH family outer membrane protein [Acidobacteriota bacterium]